MPDTSPNPYEATTSPMGEGSSDVGISAWFIFSLALLLGLLGGTLWLGPRLRMVFEDFEVSLPSISLIALHWSLPAALSLLILLFVGKEFLPFSVETKRKLNLAVAIVVIGVAGLFLYGVLAPLFVLIRDIN